MYILDILLYIIYVVLYRWYLDISQSSRVASRDEACEVQEHVLMRSECAKCNHGAELCNVTWVNYNNLTTTKNHR